jgi:PIN domain nuclease of toxin-antitoxin system
MKNKSLSASDKIVMAAFLRVARRAMKAENVKGVPIRASRTASGLVISMKGSPVDRHLAAAAIHKHTSPRPIRPSQAG